MARRRRMSKGKSRRHFSKHASKTHRRNIVTTLKRGGGRL